MTDYPFPGMNPYLEAVHLWPNVHLALIKDIQTALTPLVVPDYYVAAEERTYISAVDPDSLVGRADAAVLGTKSPGTPETVMPSGVGVLEYPLPVETPVTEEITERYLEIRQSDTHEVVTVIEVLSPANKRTGTGRDQYKKKREQVLTSLTNLIEIDLLHSGAPFDVSPQYADFHYRILVSRGWERPRGDLYPFNVDHPIPPIRVPLREGVDEPTLAIGDLLQTIYTQSRYDLRINYAENPKPAFAHEVTKWLDGLLQESGLRLS